MLMGSNDFKGCIKLLSILKLETILKGSSVATRLIERLDSKNYKNIYNYE